MVVMLLLYLMEVLVHVVDLRRDIFVQIFGIVHAVPLRQDIVVQCYWGCLYCYFQTSYVCTVLKGVCYQFETCGTRIVF